MPALTVLDCARCAEAAYSVDSVVGPNFTRSFYGDLASGFKGSYFSFANGNGVDVVIAFAGTEPDTVEDLVADIGFGAGVAPLLGGLGVVLGFLGARQLQEQMRGATEMARQAMWYAERVRGRVAVTGHSLGGGLASMVACSLGLAAVTCNAPATSQLGFRAGSGSITNIAVAGDPINHTLRLGSRIGPTMELRTGRSGGAAHSITNTVAALASGPYVPVGATAVFPAGAARRAG